MATGPAALAGPAEERKPGSGAGSPPGASLFHARAARQPPLGADQPSASRGAALGAVVLFATQVVESEFRFPAYEAGSLILCKESHSLETANVVSVICISGYERESRGYDF